MNPFKSVPIAVALAAPLLAAHAAETNTATWRGLADVKAIRHFDYVESGHEREKHDLHLPEKADGVRCHASSGCTAGSAGNKDNCSAVPFVNRQYAVAGVAYRFSRHAVCTAQIENCTVAVRWLRANAKQHQERHHHSPVRSRPE
ncbi:MAG: hypothetical protein L0Z50_20065 [Verrucomicrobiales bacterium]|nr:hypothetical protein [Verrucomicrobiales bacterium]